ncbi:MAG: winged helix-turn-helix domain-containing protein [Beijerinckiaceae bacterium]|nr:winged helix-turn-helix domain-containing protein [Beijerinckiaceae bacterium]
MLAVGGPSLSIEALAALDRSDVGLQYAPDLATAAGIISHKAPDLIVTALELPDGDCLTVINDWSCASPVIIVADGATPAQRVRAFELGADDFVGLPVSDRELALRMERALGRWRRRHPESLVRFWDFALDPGARVLRREGRGEVSLSVSERSLLELLLARTDRPTSRREIARRCLRGVFHEASRAPDMLASKLRNKLRQLGKDKALETLRGEGYRLRIEVGA